jgi:hypothetical protein
MAIVTAAAPALAQNAPSKAATSVAPPPVQEKAPETDPLLQDVASPERHRQWIEIWAVGRDAAQGRYLEHATFCSFQHARDVAEFDALGRYSLLLLTALAHRAEDLPLRRVYVRLPDREIPLVKVGSWRQTNDPAGVAYRVFGPYREDGLYLFPTSALLRTAQLQADFAANSPAFRVLEFPSWSASGSSCLSPRSPPDWLSTVQNPDPAPGALPNLKALQEFMQAKTSGLPVPASVPSPLPEARRDTPESAPQPDGPKKPASLKDLFKR